MSAQQPASFLEWYQNLPIPWYTGGPVGRAEATALGSFLDAQVALVKLATKAHFPDYAPTDALPHIGGDRQLEQGPSETAANFIIRLKTAWDDWARAGTAVELLTQLYWGGFAGAYVVQQNGLMYSLTGAPTAGVDPTPLLSITLADPNLAIVQKPYVTILVTCVLAGSPGLGALFNIAVNGVQVAGSVSPAYNANGSYYQVPGYDVWLFFPSASYGFLSTYTVNPDGTTSSTGGGGAAVMTFNAAPWWTFDGDNKHTSRFAVLFPAGGGAFTTTGLATFTGVEDGSTAHPWPAVTWNNAFPDTTYKIQVGPPTITDGSGAIVVAADNTTKTTTGVQVEASASFTGTVTVLAYQAGTANPFADPHVADLTRLRRLINRWRPAKALCMGIEVFSRVPVWGYPTTTQWGQSGLVWGASTSNQFGA